MQRRIRIIYKHPTHGKKFRFFGNPFLIVILLFILTWLFLVVRTTIKLAWDYYYPYQGRVLKIETHWADHIPFEFLTWEHLTIETPEGKTMDRFVSMQVRYSSRIKVGDYVIKKKGIRNYVRPRDKKTSQEIADEWTLHKDIGIKE